MSIRVANSTTEYFGHGYYTLYRECLLPAAQTEAEAAFLVRELRPRPGQRWLDVPCGYGRHLEALHALRPRLALHGCDLNSSYLKEPGLADRARLARADMRRLPYRAGAFHAVLCMLNSLGYDPPPAGRGIRRRPDDRDTLAEFARVLRPGGRLVLDLPNRWALLTLVRSRPAVRYASGEYEVIERFEWDAAAQCMLNETTWSWPGGRETRGYRLRLYTAAQMHRMLARTGFAVDAVYADFSATPFDRFDADRMLIVARRAA